MIRNRHLKDGIEANHSSVQVYQFVPHRGPGKVLDFVRNIRLEEFSKVKLQSSRLKTNTSTFVWLRWTQEFALNLFSHTLMQTQFGGQRKQFVGTKWGKHWHLPRLCVVKRVCSRERMPPQLIWDNKTTSGHGGGRFFFFKVKRLYLGVVAHERNISAVSRQLVVVGLFFLLKGGEKRTKMLHNCADTDLGGCVIIMLSLCSLLLTANLQTCLCSGTLWLSGLEHFPSKRNPGTSSDTQNLWRRTKKASERCVLHLVTLSQCWNVTVTVLGYCCNSITHVVPLSLETKSLTQHNAVYLNINVFLPFRFREFIPNKFQEWSSG